MLKKTARILIKISGEQLSGKYEGGLDPELGQWIASELKPIVEQNYQIVIMVGGGNYARGAQLAGHGIKRVTADHMGMLGTMMNALALTDIFEDQGLKVRCLSNIFAEQVTEPFIHRLAEKHLEKDRIVIIAGGIGRPYLTTDTAAVSLALELSCLVVLKATKVDGIYDKDPHKYPNAKKLEYISFEQALGDNAIMVMDKAAMGLAMEHNLPIIIFNALEKGNMLNVIKDQRIGTRIGRVS